MRETYGLRKRVEVVKGCREVGKKDMRLNEAMPRMKVDPESYEVWADGVKMVAEPSVELPGTQGVYLY